MATARWRDDIDPDVDNDLNIEPYGGIDVVWLSPEEARAAFDARSRELAGMSGDEFVRKWNAGEITDWDPELAVLVMMLPFMDE